MPTIVSSGGHRNWNMTRDSEGHRYYTIVFRVQVDTPGRDGPYTALYFTPGLPVPGDPWLHNNDLDLWAHCKKEVQVAEVQEKPGAPVKFFDLTFHFSTKPDDLCQDTDIQDPLLEPPKVSGSSIKYSEEATFNRFGVPLLTSSHEMIRGPQVEFDHNRDQIRISHNVALLQHDLVTSMRDTVNKYPLWGYPRRCIKLSDFSFERHYKGKCLVYYTRNYTFDISYKRNPTTGAIESGFDRDVLDEGTKALQGHWDRTTGEYVVEDINGVPANKSNPQHFKRFQDREGNVCRVILNGQGLPAGVVVAGRGYYVSITDANVGNPLTDNTKWIALVNDTDAQPWEMDVQYSTGELALIGIQNFDTYLAIADSMNVSPETDATKWLFLPNGVVDSGGYNEATSYDKGDYVIDSQNTKAGYRHIEKYHESDFLLLNIPTQF